MSLNIAILNVFLSLVVFLYNWRVNRNAVFFSLLLFIIATSHIRHALVLHAEDPFWLAVLANNFTPLWTLIGPCLYLYVRGVLTDNPQLKRSDLLHTIPFWINLAGIVPYLLTPFEYKLQVAEGLIRRLEDYKEIRVNWLLPQPVNLTVRAVLQIAYSAACMVMLSRYALPLKPRSGRPVKQASFVYPWLWGVTLYVLMIASYYLLVVILYYKNPALGRRLVYEYRVVYFLGGLLTFLPFLLMFFPDILYGIPKYRPQAASPTATPVEIPSSAEPVAITLQPDDTPRTVPALQTNEADEDPFHQLGERIRTLMEKKKPFLQVEFSVEDLARMLEVPKHHVQYCLRNVLQTRFIPLRTAYRIEHAKKMLMETEVSTTTLESIGAECGFSSRSNFYKIFKAEVGCTPGEFVEQSRRTEKPTASSMLPVSGNGRSGSI